MTGDRMDVLRHSQELAKLREIVRKTGESRDSYQARLVAAVNERDALAAQLQGTVEALTKIARPGEEFGWSDKVCREIAVAALVSLDHLGGQS